MRFISVIFFSFLFGIIAYSCNGSINEENTADIMSKIDTGKKTGVLRSKIVYGPLPNLIPYVKGNKWGYCDTNKKIMIEPQFDEVSLFLGSIAKVKLNGKTGFIDRSGKKIWSENDTLRLERNYGMYPDVRFIVHNWKIGKFGFMDTNFKMVTPFKYNEILELEDGYEEIAIDEGKVELTYGFISPSGKEILFYEIPYGSGTRLRSGFSEGLAKIWMSFDRPGEGSVGFVDTTGKIIIDANFDDATIFSEGIASVRIDNIQLGDKWKFIDKKGSTLSKMIFEDTRLFSEGLCGVKVKSKWGFADRNGKLIIPTIYDQAHDFENGWAEVKQGDYWTYINKENKKLSEIKFDYVNSFKDGYAVAKSKGTYYLFNKGGKQISQVPYSYISGNGSDGSFKVEKGNQYCFIDTSGNEIAQWKEKQKKYGVKDNNDNYIVPPIYETINGPWEGLYHVTTEGRTFYIDYKGTEYRGD